MLAAADPAHLERHLLGTLDAASYRVDAWVTSLASSRLAELRTDEELGALVGGYGWAERLAPSTADVVAETPPGEPGELLSALDDPGFLHTPSIHQAQVAALLRNAHLANGGGDDGPVRDQPHLRARPAGQDRLRRRPRRPRRSAPCSATWWSGTCTSTASTRPSTTRARCRRCPGEEHLPPAARRLDGLSLHQLWAASEDHAVDHLVGGDPSEADRDVRRRAVLRRLGAAVDAAADAAPGRAGAPVRAGGPGPRSQHRGRLRPWARAAVRRSTSCRPRGPGSVSRTGSASCWTPARRRPRGGPDRRARRAPRPNPGSTPGWPGCSARPPDGPSRCATRPASVGAGAAAGPGHGGRRPRPGRRRGGARAGPSWRPGRPWRPAPTCCARRWCPTGRCCDLLEVGRSLSALLGPAAADGRWDAAAAARGRRARGRRRRTRGAGGRRARRRCRPRSTRSMPPWPDPRCAAAARTRWPPAGRSGWATPRSPSRPRSTAGRAAAARARDQLQGRLVEAGRGPAGPSAPAWDAALLGCGRCSGPASWRCRGSSPPTTADLVASRDDPALLGGDPLAVGGLADPDGTRAGAARRGWDRAARGGGARRAGRLAGRRAGAAPPGDVWNALPAEQLRGRRGLPGAVRRRARRPGPGDRRAPGRRVDRGDPVRDRDDGCRVPLRPAGADGPAGDPAGRAAGGRRAVDARHPEPGPGRDPRAGAPAGGPALRARRGPAVPAGHGARVQRGAGRGVDQPERADHPGGGADMASITTFSRLEPDPLRPDVTDGATRARARPAVAAGPAVAGRRVRRPGRRHPGARALARRGRATDALRRRPGPARHDDAGAAVRRDGGPARDPRSSVPARRCRPPRESADGLRLAVDTGRLFLRVLAQQTTSRDYGPDVVRAFAVPEPAPEVLAALDPATAGYARLHAGRSVDGRRLRGELRAGTCSASGSRSPRRTAPSSGRPVPTGCGWSRRCSPTPTLTRRAGSPTRFEHTASIATRQPADPTSETTLTAHRYDSDTLDWYELDVNGDVNLGTTSAEVGRPVTRTVMPAPVTAPGLPARRFWELEDGRLNLAALQPAETDLGQVLLIETLSGYGNDWFVIGVELPVGHLVSSTSLVVTDTFGARTLLRPHGHRRLDVAAPVGALPALQPVERRVGGRRGHQPALPGAAPRPAARRPCRGAGGARPGRAGQPRLGRRADAGVAAPGGCRAERARGRPTRPATPTSRPTTTWPRRRRRTGSRCCRCASTAPSRSCWPAGRCSTWPASAASSAA